MAAAIHVELRRERDEDGANGRAVGASERSRRIEPRRLLPAGKPGSPLPPSPPRRPAALPSHGSLRSPPLPPGASVAPRPSVESESLCRSPLARNPAPAPGPSAARRTTRLHHGKPACLPACSSARPLPLSPLFVCARVPNLLPPVEPPRRVSNASSAAPPPLPPLEPPSEHCFLMACHDS